MDQNGKGKLTVLGWDPPVAAIAGWMAPLSEAQVNEVHRQWKALGSPDVDSLVVAWERSGAETRLTVTVEEPTKALAPFRNAQVDSINAYQESGRFHPLTCGVDSDHGLLIATRDGLKCPDCDYRQGWVPAGVADGSWRSPP